MHLISSFNMTIILKLNISRKFQMLQFLFFSTLFDYKKNHLNIKFFNIKSEYKNHSYIQIKYKFSSYDNNTSEYNDFKHVLKIINMCIFLFEAFSSWLSLQWALSLLMLHYQQKYVLQYLSNQQWQKNLTCYFNSRWSDWSENWKIYFF